MIAVLKTGDKELVTVGIEPHTFSTFKHNAAGNVAGNKTGYFGQMKIDLPDEDGHMVKYQCSIQLVEVDIYKPKK